MEQAVIDMKVVLNERSSCARLGYPRASFARHRPTVAQAGLQSSDDSNEHAITLQVQSEPVAAAANCSRQQRRCRSRLAAKAQRRASSLALGAGERQAVLDAVHQQRFIDRSVPYIYSTLLDEGAYPCSISTMYRVLRSVGEVGERRDQATRPPHAKPELCATGPGQVFAWDITKLHGPQKWTYFYLYAVIDIFSRYIVGWMVADRESSALARLLLEETIRKERLDPSKLTVHADRGSSMTSKPVAFLLADLGVTKSHSRPHVSNDNPHVESFFKTTKYQPAFPATFANLAEARAFCREFFDWYSVSRRELMISIRAA